MIASAKEYRGKLNNFMAQDLDAYCMKNGYVNPITFKEPICDYTIEQIGHNIANATDNGLSYILVTGNLPDEILKELIQQGFKIYKREYFIHDYTFERRINIIKYRSIESIIEWGLKENEIYLQWKRTNNLIQYYDSLNFIEKCIKRKEIKDFFEEISYEQWIFEQETITKVK